jgi:hypothetical protein
MIMRFRAHDRRWGWRRILELSLLPHDQREPHLRALHRESEAPWLDDDYVFYALTRVARARAARTLSEREYEDGRARLLRAARRNGIDDLDQLLPSAAQIAVAVGGWDHALEIAELERTPRRPPVRHQLALRPPALPLDQAVALYVAANDAYPSFKALEVFARETQLPIQDREQTAFLQHRDAADELLDQAEISRPTASPRARGRAGIVIRIPTAIPGAPRLTDEVLLQVKRCFAIEGLRVFDAELASGASRSQRAYKSWRVGKPWPTVSTLDKLAGFAHLRTLALRLNTSGAPALSDAPSDDDPAELALLRGHVAELERFDLLTALAAIQASDKRDVPLTERPATVYRGPRPHLGDLLALGLVAAGEVLIAVNRGQEFRATITETGDLVVEGHPPAASPTQAMELAVGYRQKPWEFWRIERDGELVPIRVLQDEARTFR